MLHVSQEFSTSQLQNNFCVFKIFKHFFCENGYISNFVKVNMVSAKH